MPVRRPWLDSLRVRLPLPHESCAIALLTPKSAALIYDRVWACPPDDVPADIAFFGGSENERLALIIEDNARAIDALAEDFLIDDPDGLTTRGLRKHRALLRTGDIAHGNAISVMLAMEAQGVTAVPVFPSVASSSSVYRAGDHAAVCAILENIPVPSELDLEWSQVQEFRRDVNRRAKLRRLTHWLDRDMIGRTPNFIADEIAIRIEDYRDALHVHGIRTTVGALSSLVDSKVLLGGAAAVAGLSYAQDPTWALAGGIAVISASAALRVAGLLVDRAATVKSLRRELAFVIDLQDQLSR